MKIPLSGSVTHEQYESERSEKNTSVTSSDTVNTGDSYITYTPTWPKNKSGKMVEHVIDIRPWGKFEILLDHPNCKVKLLTVESGHAPSYQYHKKRSELWQIISGQGVVTLDGEDMEVYPGSVVRVLRGEKHRIAAYGKDPLVFVEIQTGDYFGEDDIVRLSDNYGRIEDKPFEGLDDDEK